MDLFSPKALEPLPAKIVGVKLQLSSGRAVSDTCGALQCVKTNGDWSEWECCDDRTVQARRFLGLIIRCTRQFAAPAF